MTCEDRGESSAAAWVAYQARLADVLHVLPDGHYLEIEATTGVDPSDLDGCPPSIDLTVHGDRLRIELWSNPCLDRRFRLDAEQSASLVSQGWSPPVGTRQFELDLTRAEADHVAVLVVRAFRDVMGVLHPVFLECAELESEAAPQEPAGALLPVPAAEEDEGALVQFPTSRDELIEQAEPVFASILGAEVEYDDDGDIPLPVGESVVYARFGRQGPTIELFSYLVVDVDQTERAAAHLEMLNGTHPFATFMLEGNRVVLRYHLCASPFVPLQLRTVLGSLLGIVDVLAGELAGHVGGRRYLAEAPRPAPRTLPLARVHHSLVALIELLRLGAVSTLTVTTLFDDDRAELLRQIVLVSDGRIDCGDVEPLVLLDHLRRGLHRVVGVEVARRRAGKPQPRSQQLSLLPASEETLDEGDWDTETA